MLKPYLTPYNTEFTALCSLKTVTFTIIAIVIAMLSPLNAKIAFADDSVTSVKTAATTSSHDKVIDEIKPPVSINTKLIAEIDTSITVTLDGETLESTEVHRTDKGALYVNAMPIFQALDNDYEYDDVSKALIVRRSQDGVVMELYTDTGIVKANGKALGKLRHFGEVSEGHYILTPNAIAVLAGTKGKFDADKNEFNFKLDARLKVATGFEVFVNGVALGNLNPAPKSIGPVLILPLRPIAEELGHDVRVLDATNEVFVRRAQDSTEFKLNMDTGLVKLRDVPYGITKDVAYIDSTNLLLPVNAIETLTGTNIKVVGGSHRIEISLDERLTGAIKPMASVDEEASKAPFTVETIDFHIGPDRVNSLNLDFHVKKLNGRLRYETPDLPTSAAELEPSWMSLEYAHINGVTGTIGDYASSNRELQGVGESRIRGVSAAKVTDEGRWSLAAGVPTQGAVKISKDQSRLTYGGFAAGARFASRKGWEAGLAVKRDNLSDDQMAVLSAISGSLGRKKSNKVQWDTRVDLGVFDGPAREKALDLRASLSSRMDVTKSITVDGFAQYNGVEFSRTDLDAEEREDTITQALTTDEAILDDTSLEPETRRRGSDELTLSTSLRLVPNKDLGILKNPAVSVRSQISTSGVRVGKEKAVTTRSAGAAIATSIGKTGISVSLDANVFEQTRADGTETEFGQGFSARAYKQFDLGTVRAQYQNSNVKGQGVKESAVISVSSRRYNFPLPKEANLSVAPNLTAVWSPEIQTARGGIVANLNSGLILGKKTRLDASFGVLQSVGSGERTQTRTDKYLTVSLARKVPIGRNMALGLAYRNDLNGNQRFGLQLDSRFSLNERRKYKKTEDGRGVLKGRAFVDKNRDGQKQQDEPAIPNALVRLKGTRLALRTDRSGFYTIQNVKVGLYEVVVDGRTLPMGFALSEDVRTRATIHEGQITDVALPIVQRGQIRGFAYVDTNNNKAFDKGEERIDSVSLKLEGLKDADAGKSLAVSTSFGQFAFDDLPAGEYSVKAVSQPKYGIKAGDAVSVNLADFDYLMAKIAIPVSRVSKETKPKTIKTVDASIDEAIDPPPIAKDTMAPAHEGPAPP